MIGRFDTNGDLWIEIKPNLSNVPAWMLNASGFLAVQHAPPGRVEINLTAYMRSARHHNWVNHAMYPDAAANIPVGHK
ncbi:hypothetical protein [Bradyrhizobium cenepequi]|uniref:hypothetical protein n=1 Tax=Bradyrhizobium cenepequi TaxID=2821403 RepID=UPI001CE26FCC|nr:hypothetical protein [Bradyrhizobium cenepequi]MCA6108130.1 hypothetical protein [Bradyrhizobium cenepequi]